MSGMGSPGPLTGYSGAVKIAESDVSFDQYSHPYQMYFEASRMQFWEFSFFF